MVENQRSMIYSYRYYDIKKIFINTGDKLLVGRGSGFALAFIKEGMIVEEALNHPALELFV
jgi:hypothetical protein